MGEHEPARPAPEPIDAAETKAEIDDSAPDEVDAVVDAVVDALPAAESSAPPGTISTTLPAG